MRLWILTKRKYAIPIIIFIWALATQAHAQFTFTTNNGAITITSYTGPGGSVTIPSTFNGLPVTRIGDAAFWQNFSLLNVTIPDSVTNIGYMAFNHCIALTNVTLSQNLRTIEGNAFSYASALRNIVIPQSVTSIGARAFDDCVNLSAIEISSNVTNIGEGAFWICLKLTAITVDPLNPFYRSEDGVLFNKSGTLLIQCPGAKAGSYSIPSGTRRIAEWAISICDDLTSVTIPNSVTNIGANAFAGCLRLPSVTIPSTVTSIGALAFYDCKVMTNIIVDPLNPNYTSVNGVLFDKSTNTLLECPAGWTGIYHIPDGVSTIASWAFARCFNLTGVTIPSSVHSISNGAFSVCLNLTTVTLPGSVRSIGGAAFGTCPKLTGVYFMGNAPAADASAFTSATPTIYYLPGTSGWGPTLAGRPTALWSLGNPLILNNGAQSNGFGFTVSWATNVPVVIEACTNLANSIWQPLQTNALTNGASYFSDSQWTKYPLRFYRVRSP